MAQSRIIGVLGMARSGTSLTSMILNRLGVCFGPEEHLLKANVHNPKGYWEHQIFLEIDTEILSRFGGNWIDPPAFPPDWENTHELEDLKERARTAIEREFTAMEMWGWKQATASLTLPFWQQLLPTMQYVICFRNPLDVAHSMQRFVGCSLEQGLYLWLIYTKLALKHTSGQQRLFVFHEDWLNDWQEQLQRLSVFLGRSEAEQDDVTSKVHDLIDKDLWHNRTSAKAISMTYQLYESLSQKECDHNNIEQMFQESLEFIGPEARTKEAWKKQVEHKVWGKQLRLAMQELTHLIPQNETFILVDDNTWAQSFVDRYAIPFLERDGQYWGSPPDSNTAIREFERLHRAGAKFMVFAWPAFWWLDYYRELNHHLRSAFRCVLQNERLIVFDLQS